VVRSSWKGTAKQEAQHDGTVPPRDFTPGLREKDEENGRPHQVGFSRALECPRQALPSEVRKLDTITRFFLEVWEKLDA
jgi:hypothetical protein